MGSPRPARRRPGRAHHARLRRPAGWRGAHPRPRHLRAPPSRSPRFARGQRRDRAPGAPRAGARGHPAARGRRRGHARAGAEGATGERGGRGGERRGGARRRDARRRRLRRARSRARRGVLLLGRAHVLHRRHGHPLPLRFLPRARTRHRLVPPALPPRRRRRSLAPAAPRRRRRLRQRDQRRTPLGQQRLHQSRSHHLPRARPVGEWFLLEAQTRIGHEGVGITDSLLYDELGRVGRATQALLVTARAQRAT
ncbi:MAG TPA: hypothetical protein VG186_09585 [Solirubrobacteraceae bacterium]|nr:hypothetical protein [Solirubrobacteraceae bacterium]